MKKLFLLFTMTVCLLSLQAQSTNVWTDESLALPREVADASGNDMVAIATDNSVYVTGLFTEAFSFGTSDLEPIATSTYLLKYDAEGNKQWAIAFSGAATPTTITVAENGNIYVAGTLADEVIFGSTDGATITKEGVKEEGGVFSPVQSAAFIAEYDATGVLKAIKTYLPTALSDANPSLMYEPSIGLIINEIKIVESGIYASFLVRGEITDNGVKLRGTYYNLFDFMMEDIQAAYIVNLQSDFQFSKIITSLTALDNEPFQYKVYNSVLTINNNKLYVAFEAVGNQILTCGASSENLVFTNDGENFARGYIVAIVDLSSTPALLAHKKFENTPLDYYLMQTVPLDFSALNIVNEDVIITGCFGKDLPFDDSVVAAADDVDLFVASLNASDLSVKSAISSAQAGKEIATATAIIDGNVIISSIIDENSSLYILDLSDNSITHDLYPGIYFNGIAANGSNLASVLVPVQNETAELVVKLDSYTFGSGIDNNTKDNLSINIYPNPVVDQLFFSQFCDVEVYSLTGVLVISKKNTDSLDVDSLASGSYLAVVTTTDGKQTVPFIKK